jgi:3-deoxy-D-manno-octulosonic-acid transferase
VPAGGQNPIEPARLGAAVISGPHAWNFKEITDAMVEHGGLEIVADGDGLAAAIAADLADPGRAQARAHAALSYAEQESKVLETFIDRISPHLDAAERKRDAGA